MSITQKPIMTRDEAVAASKKRYFTGEPCRRGHLVERYTSTGGCVACILRSIPLEAKPEWHRFMPPKPFIFDKDGIKPATETEAHAAFRLMMAAEWHLAALKMLRDDPALMQCYDHELTIQEQFK